MLTLPFTLATASQLLVAYNGPTTDTFSGTFGLGKAEVRKFYFAPQFNNQYTFQAHETDLAIDPQIAVYDSRTGVRIGLNNDKSILNDDAELTLSLSAGVRYIVAVADEQDLTAGQFELTITGLARTNSTFVSLDLFGDARTTVVLEKTTDIDYLEFVAPADTLSELKVTTTGLRALLTLFDSSGKLMGTAQERLNVAGLGRNLTYRIAVYSAYFEQAGTTELTIDVIEKGVAVTNTLDAGPGSLRQAILASNAPTTIDQTSLKTIRFELPVQDRTSLRWHHRCPISPRPSQLMAALAIRQG